MKSLSDISALLEDFEKQYGYRVAGAAQGSESWFKLKLGVLSSSNASSIVAKLDAGTRATYMAELIAQVGTGVVEEINSKHMDWGNQNEDAARSYYEFSSGFSMTQLPFVFKDDSFRVGCSPDGLVTDRKGAEIKCPWASANYIKFLCENDVKSEWKWQYQFTMHVLGADEWDFCQYDPRMKIKPMKILTVERDPKMQRTLEDAIPQFIADMDSMLLKIGIKFGEQWHRIAKESAQNG